MSIKSRLPQVTQSDTSETERQTFPVLTATQKQPKQQVIVSVDAHLDACELGAHVHAQTQDTRKMLRSKQAMTEPTKKTSKPVLTLDLTFLTPHQCSRLYLSECFFQ